MNIERFNIGEHLSYEELVEYSQGNLSNSEMHRLEQHLIGCDLCNEALEGIGLLGLDNAKPVLERIKESTGTKKVNGLGLYHYLGIAASVIIIAVFGFLFIGSDDETELIAEKSEKSQDERVVELNKKSSEDFELTDSTVVDTIDTKFLAVNTDEEEAGVPATSQASITRPGTDSGLVQTEQPAIISEGAPEEDVLADMAEPPIDSTAFGKSAQDSVMIAISEVANEEDQVASKARMAAPSETEQLTESINVIDEAVEYIAPEPAKGIRAYNRYLRRNIEYPQAAKENNIEGDVILSVTINADGSIGEIVVSKSLGYGCDEEAIRLVRYGQAWTPAIRGGERITEQVNVTVSFKR